MSDDKDPIQPPQVPELKAVEATAISDSDRGDKGNQMMQPAPKTVGRSRARFLLWARRINLSRRLELVLAVLAIVSAIATFIVMSRKDTPFDVTSGRTMQALLFANLVLILAMAMTIVRWVAKIWLQRRNNAPGSILHSRVIGVFSVIAITPPIVMAVFSYLFLQYGVQTWFSEPVREIVKNSKVVADAYMIEHKSDLDNDLVGIVLSYNSMNALEKRSALSLGRLAKEEMGLRSLTEMIIFTESGQRLADERNRVGVTTTRIPNEFITRAKAGERVVELILADKTVIAITQLNSRLMPTYLFISRELDPEVLAYSEATKEAERSYDTLEGARSDILIQFNLVFILVAILLLMSAVWVGLWFSSRLVTPLSNLLNASERVAKGDLQARVPAMASSDEVGTLSRAFNRMTDQLEANQKSILHANEELDERRRFLEQVLGGVSTGVIGVRGDGRIFVPNNAACELLGIAADDLVGLHILKAIPELKSLLDEAAADNLATVTSQIQFENRGENLTLLVRISLDRAEDSKIGMVVTFDDLTEQLADQRTAAWADVARRIAHEIKNPLTPIQLSADRLRRKYGKEITTDPQIFEQCTDTIIRQVGDLRRMVDEFSSFARMPAPAFREADISDVIAQAAFLQDVGWTDVIISYRPQGVVGPLQCDGRLIGQAVTNLIKNAAESVVQRLDVEAKAKKEWIETGKVTITVSQNESRTVITIEDNGMGLPIEQKDRLMEPYVTTRKSGTGLGLAIVRRIAEEHGAKIRIMDRKSEGARAELTLIHSALIARAEKFSDEAAE